ncbi:MAG TPA: hypothetical protein VFR47_19870 [Anaerolineales bacterium]|nr:hypothetical protein [Anaerolineales bacterium]
MMSTDQTTIFMDHIRKHASNYYRDFGTEQTGVHLVDKMERRTVILYRFRVSNNTQTHSVFVKVPSPLSPTSPTNGSVCEKPPLFPKVDPHDKLRLQYSALKAIYEYFTSLHTQNLGAIRVLDYLPEYDAIFTEESYDLKLRQLFFRKNRLYSKFFDNGLIPAFRNAGAWLSAYHKMPKDEDVFPRDSHREDYMEAIIKLKDFLVKTLGDESFFNTTSSILLNEAQEIFPKSLPLGLGHGDFAPRNILIGPDARVTVLDTLARWRTPIYEDIGYFLNELKTSYPQVVSQGLAFSANQLATHEQAFLKGYFDQEPIPYSAIQLYEALALLDKWSSTIARLYQQPDSIQIATRLKIKLASRYFKRRAKSLLEELVNSENRLFLSYPIINRK